MKTKIAALVALFLCIAPMVEAVAPWSGRKFITALNSTITVTNNNTTGGVDIAAIPSVIIGTNITKHVCTMLIGADNGAFLVDADIGPQTKQCFIPVGATVNEITINADAGTPSVLVRKITAGGSASNLLTGALSTAAAGAVACSNTGGTLGIDGATTCSATLQNGTLAAGVWIELLSGTAGGVTRRLTVSLTYTTTI